MPNFMPPPPRPRTSRTFWLRRRSRHRMGAPPGPPVVAHYHARHMSESPRLPVDEVLPALRARLAEGRNAVLVAPPGAGKSTVVPLALLQESWTAGLRLLLLEPRRLAARAVATRMAATLGGRPGETVGWRMRLGRRVGPRTRLEAGTEGSRKRKPPG